MKKLVVMAAALVAAAGSYAQCEPGTPPVEADCSQVYNVSISLKTTAAKSGSIDIGTDCAPGSTSLCYRVISSKSYKGYYWNCSCGCDEFANNVLDLFETKSKDLVVYNGTIDWESLVRIGKKNTEIEAAGTIDDSIFFMGFGKYDVKNARVSSISGNVQAFLVAPSCTVDCAPGSTSVAYDICTLAPVSIGTIGYGSFSLKYNSSISKKLAASTGDYMDSLLPSVPVL